MADVAISRIQLVDNSRLNAAGKRIHRILPWQIVTPDGWAPMLEPVDNIVNDQPVNTTKQITGILFVDESVFRHQNGVGGDAGYWRYASNA